MIDRETAIYTLHELEDSDILNDELVQKLADIRTCIEAELDGWHFWGASDDDYMKLHIARRGDLWTDELRAECEEIDKAHTFVPAEYEAQELINRFIKADD